MIDAVLKSQLELKTVNWKSEYVKLHLQKIEMLKNKEILYRNMELYSNSVTLPPVAPPHPPGIIGKDSILPPPGNNIICYVIFFMNKINIFTCYVCRWRV